jgi:putative ABC transport system permease protein
VKYKERAAERVDLLGTTEQYQFTSSIRITQGRFLSAADAGGGRPVCVIGAQTATNLFKMESPLGNRIRINDTPFEVIGVMDHQGEFLGMFSLDNRIIIPLDQFMTTIWNDPDVDIEVKATSMVQLEDAREEVRQVMRRLRQVPPSEPDDFAINQTDQFVKMFYSVAGIGIMNIMFVSVAERTREIGVRKAIGAKRRTILLQFLIEAACICCIGGLIGLGIAWPLTLLLNQFMTASLSIPMVVLALSVSLCTGVISGFLPAWRAARLNPVDALRSE